MPHGGAFFPYTADKVNSDTLSEPAVTAHRKSMKKPNHERVACFAVRAYGTKHNFDAQENVDELKGLRTLEEAREEADSGQYSALYQVEVVSIGEDGTESVVYRRFNPTLEERSLLVSALQRVERWMLGYGTTTQSDMREFVRETLKKVDAERG
jgi:hypothetical protein